MSEISFNNSAQLTPRFNAADFKLLSRTGPDLAPDNSAGSVDKLAAATERIAAKFSLPPDSTWSDIFRHRAGLHHIGEAALSQTTDQSADNSLPGDY